MEGKVTCRMYPSNVSHLQRRFSSNLEILTSWRTPPMLVCHLENSMHPDPVFVAAKTDIKTRIVVIDDHPLVREAVSELINQQQDMTCCGTAGTILSAKEVVAKELPDLVVLDLRLGPEKGLDLIKVLKKSSPTLRILVLSELDVIPNAQIVLREGASGYVIKEQATEVLLHAIRMVRAGMTYPPQDQLGNVLNDPSQLPSNLPYRPVWASSR
jgi:CheY-like chemotaxis protein